MPKIKGAVPITGTSLLEGAGVAAGFVKLLPFTLLLFIEGVGDALILVRDGDDLTCAVSV